MLGGLCSRCLIAEGLEADTPAASDTSRFSNPFFIRSFGDYELLQEVARGGMGVIYKAKQRSLGRIVAIKVLSSGEFASPEYVRRFRAEAEAAAKLQHPNIVAIHEVGQHEGVRYFSMDFVEGPNLSQLLGGVPLPAPRAAGYLKTLADAIQYAHKQGILHRDLKPSNVLIDPFGEPRVTDFGLAKEMTGDSDLTTTGQILGTPGYLPPEQADTSHGPLSPASDVYSLGAILYYMLTTRAPFGAGSLRETLRQVLTHDPVAPSLLNPDIPRDLETICMKCLERNPTRRYQTAAELAEDLRRFIEHEPIVARPVSPLGHFTRWCRRRPTLAAVWVLAVALAVGSTVSALWISRALGRAQAAEALGRERLRDARLAEARAVRHTTAPGRRSQALAALAEAARVRPGPDVRDEAFAALMLSDIKPGVRWDPALGFPTEISFNPSARVAALEMRYSTADQRGPAILYGWGDPHPLGQIAVEGTNRAVGPIRFSVDAKVVMSRFIDETFRVWHTGETNAFLILTNRPLPDPHTLVETANDDYDFSPDGKLFVIGLPEDGFSLHRVSDGVELGRWQGGHQFTVIRFSPDGSRIAAARTTSYEERQAFVFDAAQLTLTNVFNLRAAPDSLAWSSDGRTLAVPAEDSTIALFDVRNGRVAKNLVCPGLGPGELYFVGRDSLLGFRGLGSTFRLVNPVTGGEELVLDGFGPSMAAVEAGSDSFVAASLEAVATRWTVEQPTGFRVIPAPRPGGYEVDDNNCCFDFSPDGRWVASGHGRYALIRDVASGLVVDDLDTGDPRGVDIVTVAFCDGGRRLLHVSSRFGVHRYALDFDSAGRPHFGKAETLDTERGYVMSDHLSDGTRLVLVDGIHGRVKVVAIGADGEKVLSHWETPEAYGGAISPDGELVVVNCNSTKNEGAGTKLQVHRVSDGSVVHELAAFTSGEVAWCANGKMVFTSNGETQSIFWDATTWRKITTLDGRTGGNTTTFALAPDGSSVAVCRDESVYLVAPATGVVMAKLEIPYASGLAGGVRFLPDGRRFAILWQDGRIDIIDSAALRDGVKQLGLDW